MAPTVTYIDNLNEVKNKYEKSAEKSHFPYDIKKVDEKTNAELLKVFKGKFIKLISLRGIFIS